MRMQEYLTKLVLSKRILEIGPFCDPIISKKEGNVYYADIQSTEELISSYSSEPSFVMEKFCPIDHVIKGSYTQSLQSVPKFDYIISSHVLEHIPNLIDFFLDIANVLSEKGEMYAFLPDSRYCYEHFRFPTSFGELYYIYSQKLPLALWQVLDAFNGHIPQNDPVLFTYHPNDYSLLAQREPFENTLKKYQAALQGEYFPEHYSVFTPRSFLLIIHDLLRAQLFPFKLISFFPTPRHSHTFGVHLLVNKLLLVSPELADIEMQKIRNILAQNDKFEAQNAISVEKIRNSQSQ